MNCPRCGKEMLDCNESMFGDVRYVCSDSNCPMRVIPSEEYGDTMALHLKSGIGVIWQDGKCTLEDMNTLEEYNLPTLPYNIAIDKLERLLLLL